MLARKKEVKPVSGVLHKAVSIIDAAAEEAVDEVDGDEDEADDDNADNEEHDDEEEEENHAALKLMTLISSSAAPLRRLLCNQPQSMREPHRPSASFVRHCFCICFSNTSPSPRPPPLLHHQRESCVHFLVAKKIKHLFFSVKNSTNLLTNQSRRH